MHGYVLFVVIDYSKNRNHKSFQAACCPEGGGSHKICLSVGRQAQELVLSRRHAAWLRSSGASADSVQISGGQLPEDAGHAQDASEVEFWQLQLQGLR